LSDELLEMLKKMPKGLPGANVFTRDGKPISSLRVAFEGACQRAQVDGFTFHDFRRTAETNMRRAGIDPTIIMAILGHKSTAMFMRYNTVSRDELKSLGEKSGQSGQYLDSN
jgi:integrase